MSNAATSSVIVITGASSGIGEATARLFAREGWWVVLAARRRERLEALARDLEALGVRALPVPTDVTRWEDAESLARTTWEAFGRVDVLFNNAGFIQLDWFEAMDPHADIARQVLVNLLGTMWVTRAFLPGMMRQGFGHIVNMASVAGHIAPPTYSVYAATKFGVRGFSEGLRRDVALHNIRVSVISPGGVETDFVKDAKSPLRQLKMDGTETLTLTPEQVARAVWGLVRRPRRERVIPGLYRPLIWLNRAFPALTDFISRRLLRRLGRGPGGMHAK